MSDFEIKRRNEAVPVLSIYVPAGFIQPRGMFISRDTTSDAQGDKQAALANVAAIGALQRDITASGASDVDRAQLYPGRIELAEKPQTYVTVDPVAAIQAFEVEGSSRILQSGTGAIDTNTAIGSKLSFKNGKVYLAQTGDVPQYTLGGFPTPETNGNLRIYCEKI